MTRSEALARVEAILDEAVQFGDTHDACVKALEILRRLMTDDRVAVQPFVRAECGNEGAWAQRDIAEALRRLPGLRDNRPLNGDGP